MKPSPLQEATGWILDLVQIAFYVVVGIITLLSYRRARRGVLQPETFKYQLQSIAEVSEMICGKSELQLREFFALGELIRANAQQLFDDFATDFSDKNDSGRSDKGARLYAAENVTEYDINLKSAVASEWVQIGPPGALPASKVVARNHKTERDWSDYEWEYFHRVKKYVAARNLLDGHKRSPLMPDAIAKEIEEFEGVFPIIEDATKRAITKCGQDLFRRRQAGLLQVISSRDIESWVHNEANKDFPQLSTRAARVSSAIKSYVRADEVMP